MWDYFWAADGRGATGKGRVAKQIIQRGRVCQGKHSGELGSHRLSAIQYMPRTKHWHAWAGIKPHTGH